jgi:hypothetical protein
MNAYSLNCQLAFVGMPGGKTASTVDWRCCVSIDLDASRSHSGRALRAIGVAKEASFTRRKDALTLWRLTARHEKRRKNFYAH